MGALLWDLLQHIRLIGVVCLVIALLAYTVDAAATKQPRKKPANPPRPPAHVQHEQPREPTGEGAGDGRADA